MHTLVIETDELGAAELQSVAEGTPNVEFQARKVEAQVGDPDTWMVVAQVASDAVPFLGAALLLLIRQRKIPYLKLGDLEFRNISVEEFEQVMDRLEPERPADGD